MVTQKGDNTLVVGIHGNFDDAQTGVKRIFGDKAFEAEMKEKGFQFSSANSINIGRLIPQVVYYVYAYSRLAGRGVLQEGEPLHVTVPTGNFGNILAAYYAKEMGLPLGKLLCASNSNKVLYDFFQTGIYDRNREFILTASPSMDILISSNLERLIYHIAGNDANKNKELMQSLAETGSYRITSEMRERMADFGGAYATEEETFAAIKTLYDNCHYVLDTHTGVAAAAYEKYSGEASDAQVRNLIVSTASPYKFPRSVIEAITGKKQEDADDFALVELLHKLSGVEIPPAVTSLQNALVRHTMQCDIDGMLDVVRGFL
jgi:threonine synthase